MVLGMSAEKEYRDRLKEIVLSDPRLGHILRAAREVNAPAWVVGAGAIRSTVWDFQHGYTAPTPLEDLDLAYFDDQDLGEETERAIEHELEQRFSEIPWDVHNQADVHLWYNEKFGLPIPPLRSIEDAIGTWPETSSAVAVRLTDEDDLVVVAPFGLRDLFEMILRRNPRLVSRELFLQRLADKKIRETWPKVRVIDD